MRITQSMLSNNMLRNLNNNYGKMGKLQEQLTSGSKINRPSDDPVAVIKGMTYRTDLNKVKQFERNMNTVHSWLDSSDESLGEVGEAMHRVKELVIQASSDTNTPEEREKIKTEIEQIQQQIRDVGNTKVAGKYIFSGTKTNSPLFDSNGSINTDVNEASVNIEVFDGVQIQVNTPGNKLFEDIDNMMSDIMNELENGNGESIGNLLGGIESAEGSILEARADIGARQNRVEMIESRLSGHEISVTKQLSQNEDVDYAETITEMVTYQSLHQAALSVGANIIQQSLVDFIR